MQPASDLLGTTSGPDPSLAPDWLDELPFPVWLVDRRGRLARPNPAAREFLDLSRGPCHRCLAGQDLRGAPFCSATCLPLRCLREGLPQPGLRILRTPRLEPFQLLSIPIVPSQWLLHMALPLGPVARWANYLAELSSRSGRPAALEADRARLARLTPRELEVLEALAHDRTSFELAGQLGIHPTTARNHIQHLLAKLEAHSIGEAVGRYLLARTGMGPG